MHGDRLQREREEALRDFKSGRFSIMVATGVAARGLDIPSVQHVINYDLPGSVDEYVHRIGRTGRIGNSGRATSFFDSSRDGPLAADLRQVLSDAQQEVPNWLSREAAANSGLGSLAFYGGFGGRDMRQRPGGRHAAGVGYEDADPLNTKPTQALESDVLWDGLD